MCNIYEVLDCLDNKDETLRQLCVFETSSTFVSRKEKSDEETADI